VTKPASTGLTEGAVLDHLHVDPQLLTIPPTRSSTAQDRYTTSAHGKPRVGSLSGARLVHVWSTCHRSRAVRSGFQRYIVRSGRRCHPGGTGPGQNPDKDEVPGSSPGRPTSQHHSSQRRRRAGAAVGSLLYRWSRSRPAGVGVLLTSSARPPMDSRPMPRGMGRQQPKTRTRRWGRRSTTMGFGSYPAGIGRGDGGRGRSRLQPIRQRSATESLHQVSALAQAPACR
jgi:hypothetical protein